MTLFSEHVAKWRDCQRCPLHVGRQRVVFARGSVPADVAFVGEAPGVSEDSVGLPFVGPAGELLDRIVERAVALFPGITWCCYNVVGCFPAEAKKTDDHSPPEEAIRKCRPRLTEFLRIAQPQLVVAVGSVAADSIGNGATIYERVWNDKQTPHVSIEHPASILRKPAVQQQFAVQRTLVTLTTAFEKYLIPF